MKISEDELCKFRIKREFKERGGQLILVLAVFVLFFLNYTGED